MRSNIEQDENLESVKISLARKVFLNEIVTGQKEEYINYELNNLNEKLNIEFKDYYVLLTGIKKEIYNGIYNFGAAKYLEIFNEAVEVISQLFHPY